MVCPIFIVKECFKILLVNSNIQKKEFRYRNELKSNISKLVKKIEFVAVLC
ncbi:hypothetical protein LEP1GSC065_1437 [Leptospira kirschneri serovar Sokoine str. RM1]|nr:hypothetical protein LEP1GSC065_1437 [Leptospira kirschneri serovar Sokoine str. RM1]